MADPKKSTGKWIDPALRMGLPTPGIISDVVGRQRPVGEGHAFEKSIHREIEESQPYSRGTFEDEDIDMRDEAEKRIHMKRVKSAAEQYRDDMARSKQSINPKFDEEFSSRLQLGDPRYIPARRRK